MLVKAGLTEEFIERLEAAVHGDQGRTAEGEDSVPETGIEVKRTLCAIAAPRFTAASTRM